jgi:hypothetical protein
MCMKPTISSLVAIAIALVACQPGPSPTPVPQPLETASPEVSLIGRPLKGSQPAIYRLMEDGRLRHIGDWATYLALGYQADSFVQVSDETLAGYTLDLPLTRWMTSQADSPLYFLQKGQRYRVPTIETMEAMGGSPAEVSLVADDFLRQFPLAPDPLPPATSSGAPQPFSGATTTLWAAGRLWIADPTGSLTQWDVTVAGRQAYQLPGKPGVYSLIGDGQTIYAGTDGGVWQLPQAGPPVQLVASPSSRITALAVDADSHIWYADSNYFDLATSRYHIGRGVVRRESSSGERVYALFGDDKAPHDPLKSVSAMAFDPQQTALWVGTRFAGVLRYDLKADRWQAYTAFNSKLMDNAITDLEFAPDGSLWLTTPSGVSSYRNGEWENWRLAEGLTGAGALSLAVAKDNTVWVAGDNYLAWHKRGKPWQVLSAIDYPPLGERFDGVALDDDGHPWFVAQTQRVYFDGKTWATYNTDLHLRDEFTPGETPAGVTPPPLEFPPPTQDYTAWLKTWPRPEADNGRGIHFFAIHWFGEADAQRQINRMQELGMRWTLVTYANRYQLARTAPLFKQVGIVVVWRPFVRPYQSYQYWAEDVKFLRSQGIAPYIQLYNEPSLAQEWDDLHPIDQETYLRDLLPAIRQVYDAGGYVGLQFINLDWLRLTLRRMKAEGMDDVFDRLFFVPHPYGLNHPPEYDQDMNGVLGFREFAKVFEEEIGFVPVMIAGEGGWRPGEAQDSRYPLVSETLHRDYLVAVFDWFRTGRLSDGEPLPDYFFAFCPWLISDPDDPAAWFDSASGDRTLTIEAVKAMGSFERKFSWDKQ